MRMRYSYNSNNADPTSAALGFGCFGCCLGMFGAWATHIVWIIGVLASSVGATAGQIILGILGSILFPIGIIHGIMIWFGTGM